MENSLSLGSAMTTGMPLGLYTGEREDRFLDGSASG